MKKIFGLLVLPLFLAGCGESPAEGTAQTDPDKLYAYEWVLEDIDGKGIIDRSHATLTFDRETGRVYGSTGCNRYNGAAKLSGQKLSFGLLASTMMACLGEGMMQQEHRFTSSFEKIRTWSLGEDNLLRLYDAAGAEVLRFAAQETTALPVPDDSAVE